ncbi:DUF962 domain-containing protein [Bradyrhizobium yuanmingense]|nr:DUF962 domain-containing protein [Bradyrhizobium yuanmingense]
MNSYLRRWLADYVEYHRAPWNCAMHVLGILFLFLAPLLPLSLWFPTAFGIKIPVAIIALAPALIFWLSVDFALGFVILGAAVALLEAAAVILNHVTIAEMCSLTAILMVTGAALLIIGHLVFERRRPAMIDNPVHLLVGPMFIAAKLVVALGFRDDLRIILRKLRQSSPQTKLSC